MRYISYTLRTLFNNRINIFFLNIIMSGIAISEPINIGDLTKKSLESLSGSIICYKAFDLNFNGSRNLCLKYSSKKTRTSSCLEWGGKVNRDNYIEELKRRKLDEDKCKSISENNMEGPVYFENIEQIITKYINDNSFPDKDIILDNHNVSFHKIDANGDGDLDWYLDNKFSCGSQGCNGVIYLSKNNKYCFAGGASRVSTAEPNYELVCVKEKHTDTKYTTETIQEYKNLLGVIKLVKKRDKFNKLVGYSVTFQDETIVPLNKKLKTILAAFPSKNPEIFLMKTSPGREDYECSFDYTVINTDSGQIIMRMFDDCYEITKVKQDGGTGDFIFKVKSGRWGYYNKYESRWDWKDK